jgi:hypothetical protein
MNDNLTLHVLLLEEDYAVTSWGSGPCGAVQRHFDEMDMFCSPSSDYDTEEACVTVFSIPRALEDDLAGEFEDMESDALADAILRLAEKHPEITKAAVKFAYESGDLRVSPVEPMILFMTDDT